MEPWFEFNFFPSEQIFVYYFNAQTYFMDNKELIISYNKIKKIKLKTKKPK